MRGRKEVKKVCKSKIRQCTHIINSLKWYFVHVSWELILFDKVINALIFVNRNDKSTSVNSAEGDHDVMTHQFLFLFFLAFDFCRFCVVIRFFHPRHNGQWPPTSKDFYTRSYPLHYFLIIILEKEPIFPFWMFSAKQGNYWYHFYNVFGMTRSLTGDWTRDLPHSKPALYH